MDGSAYVWGGTASGQLGLGAVDRASYEEHCNIPTLLSLRQVRVISCGSSHSAAATVGGELWMWGSGDGGRLGLGMPMVDVFRPCRVDSLVEAGQRISDVSCGGTHTIALSSVEDMDYVKDVDLGYAKQCVVDFFVRCTARGKRCH